MAGIFDLAVLGQFMAQLPDDIHDLGHTGRTHRVAAGLQTARDIDGDLASKAGLTGRGRLAAFALLKETDMLTIGNLQDREGIMQLGHIDISRFKLGHLEGLPGSQRDGLQVSRIFTLLQRVRVSGLAEAGDQDGQFGQLFGHLQRAQYQRGCPIADRAEIVQMQRISRGGIVDNGMRAVEDAVAVERHLHVGVRIQSAHFLVLQRDRQQMLAASRHIFPYTGG